MDSISIRNMSYTYHEQGHAPRTVLRKANLQVSQGAVLCVCGQSGQGKSTLLRLIAGLQKPQEGQIFFFGVESDLHEHNALTVSLVHKVAFVFQNSALISNLTVFDNVALPIRYHNPGKSESEIRDQVENILQSMMVEEYAQHYPYSISMGAQRRVAIARALALEPRILLMDEPTTGLDAKNRRSLLALIDNQRTLRHATIVMVTHDLPIAKELNGQIVSLHQGELSSPMDYDDFMISPEDHIRELVQEINQW